MHFIDLKSYVAFRPMYPPQIYQFLSKDSPFSNRCKPSEKKKKILILELGAGTGYSSLSFLKAIQTFENKDHFQIEILAVDENSELLTFAERELKENVYDVQVKTLASKIDSLFFRDLNQNRERYDFIQVASSFHWFHHSLSAEDFLSILNQEGILFIHEYQFPKSKNNASLNQYIKKGFNEKWKAIEQKPRGSLRELTNRFRNIKGFKEIHLPEVKMEYTIEPLYFSEHLFSQSRFLAYESTLSEEQKKEERKIVVNDIEQFFLSDSNPFDFNWKGFAFKRSH